MGTKGQPSAKNVAQGSNSTGDGDKVRTEDIGSVENQKSHSSETRLTGHAQGPKQEEGQGKDDGVFAEMSAVKEMLIKQQKLSGGIRMNSLMLCVGLGCFMLPHVTLRRDAV